MKRNLATKERVSASTHQTAAFSDYTGPDLFCSTVFIFFLILGRALD